MKILIKSVDPHKSIAPKVAAKRIAAYSPIGLLFFSAYSQLIRSEKSVESETTALNAIEKLSAIKAPRNEDSGIEFH